MARLWFGRSRKAVAQNVQGISSRPATQTSPKDSNLGIRTVSSPPATPRPTAPSTAVPRVTEQNQSRGTLVSSIPSNREEKGKIESSRSGIFKRRPKNTVVVSLQMPAALVGVLDDIVTVGAYRSRSDVILQAIRSHPEVSRRLLKLEPKQSSKK